jgi:hypothetical protein
LSSNDDKVGSGACVSGSSFVEQAVNAESTAANPKTEKYFFTVIVILIKFQKSASNIKRLS